MVGLVFIGILLGYFVVGGMEGIWEVVWLEFL